MFVAIAQVTTHSGSVAGFSNAFDVLKGTRSSSATEMPPSGALKDGEGVRKAGDAPAVRRGLRNRDEHEV